MAVGAGLSVLQSRSLLLPNKNARSLTHEQMKVYMTFITAIVIIWGNIQGLKVPSSHSGQEDFPTGHSVTFHAHIPCDGKSFYKLRKGFKSLSYTVL